MLTLAGRASEALAAGAAVLPSTSGEQHAALCLAMSRAAVASGQWAEAVALVERSGRAGDPRADAVAADALFGAGEVARAEELAATVVDNPLAPPASVCEALEVMGRCARVSDAARAETWFRRGAQVAAEYGLVTARVRALHSLATVELAQTGTSPALQEARDVAETAGMLATVAQIDVVLGDVLAIADGPEAGIGCAIRAIDTCDRLGLVELHATASVGLAWLLALSGDRQAARDRIADVADVVARVPDLAAMATMVRGVDALIAGDLAQARDRFDEGIDVLARNPAGAPLAAWGLWVLVRAVCDDRPDEARRILAASHAMVRMDNRAAEVFSRAVTAGRAGDGDSGRRADGRGGRDARDTALVAAAPAAADLAGRRHGRVG